MSENKGIIIVSHSKKLADGVKELVEQMKDDSIKIIAVGGTEDGEIGTDAFAIIDAINELQDALYILVYADLGSSILSTETALDMVDEEVAKKVHIVDAPLVEGAFSGVIYACNSSDPQEVIQASKEAESIAKS